MRVTLSSLRSQMGIMLQDSFLFTGTIADNIRYGKLDATDEEIHTAAKLIGANHFIEKLPYGYNTHVTERSGGISQGERQLLAFTRTLISNPRILILDEATSSIDTRSVFYFFGECDGFVCFSCCSFNKPLDWSNK
jgi:ATP-binding cassette, subfamily B, multidrug efflux pump